jgi:hypothetical protein
MNKKEEAEITELTKLSYELRKRKKRDEEISELTEMAYYRPNKDTVK